MSNGRLIHRVQPCTIGQKRNAKWRLKPKNERSEDYDAEFAVDRRWSRTGEIACKLARKYRSGSHATALLLIDGEAIRSYCLTVLNDWSRACRRASYRSRNLHFSRVHILGDYR